MPRKFRSVERMSKEDVEGDGIARWAAVADGLVTRVGRSSGGPVSMSCAGLNMRQDEMSV